MYVYIYFKHLLKLNGFERKNIFECHNVASKIRKFSRVSGNGIRVMLTQVEYNDMQFIKSFNLFQNKNNTNIIYVRVKLITFNELMVNFYNIYKFFVKITFIVVTKF